MDFTIEINGATAIEAYNLSPPHNIDKFLLGKAGKYRFKFGDLLIRQEPPDILDVCVRFETPPALISVDDITIDLEKNRIIARIDKKEATNE